MLQDGLAYDELLASAGQRPAPTEGDSAGPTASTPGRKYAFVMSKKRRASDVSAMTSSEATRKKPRREVEEPQPQPPVPEATELVRPRQRGRKKSTVARVQAEEIVTTETEAVEPEPKPSSPPADVEMTAESPIRPTNTLEVGNSIGVQTEPLPPEPSATTILDSVIPGAQIFSLNWSRSDPSRLTATGDSIWKSWFISPTTNEDERLTHPRIVDHGVQNSKAFISACAIARASGDVALAVEQREGQAELLLQIVSSAALAQETSDTEITCLCPDNDTVVALRWSESADVLLALSTANGRAKISLYAVAPEPHFLDEAILQNFSYDVVWINNTDFITCGAPYLFLFTLSPTLHIAKKLQHTHEFSAMRFDKHTRRVACIDIFKGRLHLLDTKLFQLEASATQEGGIHAAEWQPTQDWIAGAPRILATASPRGTVNIWDARQTLQLLHIFEMGDRVAAQAIAFSPDGQLIAAAGENRVRVWKVMEKPEEGRPILQWQAPSSQQEQEEEQDRMDVERAATSDDEESWAFGQLSWNVDGSRVAYSNGDKLRVLAIWNTV
jgi:WD40 repeat protein